MLKANVVVKILSSCNWYKCVQTSKARMEFIRLLNWKVQGAGIVSGMTGSRGTKCYQIFFSSIAQLCFPLCCLIFQYIFPESSNITYRNSDSHRHSLPTPVESGSLFPSRTRQSLRIYLQIYLNHAFMSQSITVARETKCMFIPGAEGGGVSITQTEQQRNEKGHLQRKIRVLWPEDSRIVTGQTDAHHSFSNQCCL